MTVRTLLLIILLTTSCNETRKTQTTLILKGNWYTDTIDGEGIYKSEDSLTSYCEYYIGDSTLIYYVESNGPGHEQKYFIKGDSIFKSFYVETEFIPMYKIEKYNFDTLWLTINSTYANGHPNTFWVRLPSEERGIIDHQWTDKTKDSLMIRISKDFDRRRWKFYSIRGNDMTGYDSALRAGYWGLQ